MCSPFFHDEFKLAHRCVCIKSNISNELIWMREERKWLRHPIVRLTAAAVQQDKGLGRCNPSHLPLLNSWTSSLKSHETNNYHSSKVPFIVLERHRSTPLTSFRSVCVFVWCPRKKSVIPPEIPRKICHAKLSMFSQLSLYLSNRIYDSQGRSS